MIKQYKLALKCDKDLRISSLWGYRFYGALMEIVGKNIGDAVHVNGQTSISQYLTPTATGGIWTVTLFGEIAEALSNSIENINSFTINSPEMNVTVCQRDVKIISHYDVLTAFRRFEHGLPISLRFLTPTAFKSDGRYIIMPSKELILGSLIDKWNNYVHSSPITDSDAITAIKHGVSIVSYDLRSCKYPLKGIKIPSFLGKITLGIRLAAPLYDIVAALLAFADYSGVGIKCGLGMGGVSQEIRT